MHKRVLIAAGLMMLSVPAQAATIGLVCDTGAKVIVSGTEEAANACVANYPGCTVGFTASGGYWALAATEDLSHQSAAGGYRSEDGAGLAAIAACEAQGGEGCTVMLSGLDDGHAMEACD